MVHMKAFDAKIYFCVLHMQAVVCYTRKSDSGKMGVPAYNNYRKS